VSVIITLKLRFVYGLKKHGITHDDPSSGEFYNSIVDQHKVIIDQRHIYSRQQEGILRCFTLCLSRFAAGLGRIKYFPPRDSFHGRRPTAPRSVQAGITRARFIEKVKTLSWNTDTPLSKQHPDGFYVLGGTVMRVNEKQIVEFALKSRIPSMYFTREFVDAGGLMSYGADRVDSDRRVAYFVDKILKGAKPADLPIERPTKFEFIINLKTAKQIGLIIPPNVLARADKVIK
jgi:hypothetical protein